jgi:hypothetical protein
VVTAAKGKTEDTHEEIMKLLHVQQALGIATIFVLLLTIAKNLS